MTSDVADALARLEAAFAHDQRIREMEKALAGLTVTVQGLAQNAAQQAAPKAPIWPSIVASVVGIGALVVAFASLLMHTT